jgi:hypothetical protein
MAKTGYVVFFVRSNMSDGAHRLSCRGREFDFPSERNAGSINPPLHLWTFLQVAKTALAMSVKQ